jgi:hypothetical protein
MSLYAHSDRPAGRDSLPPVTKCGVGNSVQNLVRERDP